MLWFKKIYASFNSRERMAFIASLALAVLAGASLAWLFFINITVEAPARGGEYSEGLVGQPSYVNPVLAETATDKNLVRLTFASLSDLSAKIAGDKTGKIFNVRLKENLLWSDGTKLTSDDIIFTLLRLQDPQTNSPSLSAWQGVSVTRVSELELQFALVTPYAFFPQSLLGLYPIPKHLFADTPAANWKLSDFNLRPVGSGPFVFASYDKRDDGFITGYHLVPNKYFAGEKPFIDKYNFVFSTKVDDVLKNFNSGLTDSIADVQPDTIANIKRTYNLHEFKLPNYYAVFFNQSKNTVLADESVRKALTLATDKPRILKDALLGYGRISNGPVPEGLPNTNVSETETGFDLGAASALLDSSGWKLGDNGMRSETSKNSVTTLQFKLTVPNIPFLVSTAKILAEDWKKIGAQADLDIVPPEDVVSGAIKERSYDAVLFGNLLGPNGDLYAFWHSTERYYPGSNLSLLGDKNVDKLLESIRQNPDTTSRNIQLQSVAGAISAEYPAIFLFSPSSIFVSSRDLGGLRDEFLNEAADRLHSAGNWYVKTTRVLK